MPAKKLPPTGSPTAVSPVPVLPTTSTARVAGKKGAAAAKVDPPVAVPVQPVADPVKPARVRRQPPVQPMSPRTTTAKLSGKADDAPTYQDVRMAADSITKNLTRLTNLATTVGRKGRAESNGVVYSNNEVRAFARQLAKAIRKIAPASRASGRKSQPVISAAERDERIRLRAEQAFAGVDELSKAIAIPNVSKVLCENARLRIESVKCPSRPGLGVQISAAFFISDPLREFIRNANFGNGFALLFPNETFQDSTRRVSGAENPDAAIKAVTEDLGRDPLPELGLKMSEARALADPRRVLAPLILESGIATSPLLMSIMACYIAANDLKTEGGRIRIDENMKRHFGTGTTRYIFDGKDYTPKDAPEEVNLSGIERIKRREPAEGSNVNPCDGETFVRAMSIALASLYRIPHPPAEMAAKLTDKRTINLANGVKAYL